MPTTLRHRLNIYGLELHIHLGWTEAERINKQVILVDMEMLLSEAPKACLSDDLADTFCYHTLVDHITLAVGEKPFRLIEHLAQQIHQVATPLLPAHTKLNVRVKKNPPIASVKNGVTFSIEDPS